MTPKDELQILVADDDPTLLDLMTHRFNKRGLKVDRAEDGRAAAKMIERKDYDLIVTDIYMPGGTGLALLKQARAKDSQVQVIVVTAGATLENAVEALNNGAFAYLTKPFDHLSVFDNVASRALEFRRLMLDNVRLAEIQKRRGDMLEDEVTQRVSQLRQRQKDLLDLLGSLPDGILVVEEGGRVSLSSPTAEKWLAREMRSAGQPIQRFIETVHDEWAEESVDVEIGDQDLRLTWAELPSTDEKKRKVVIIRELEETESAAPPDMSDPIAGLKKGLSWLYKQDVGDRVAEVLKQLAYQVSELERLNQLSGGPNGRSPEPPPEPQSPAQIEPEVQLQEPTSSAPLSESTQEQLERLNEVEAPELGLPEAEVQIEHSEPIPEELVEEKKEDAAPPEQKEPPKSGMLMKHLKPSPDEDKSAQSGPIEEPSSATDFEPAQGEALGDDGAQEMADDQALGEPSVDIGSRLGISSKGAEVGVDLEHLGEPDSTIEVELETALREREASKPASWPPAPPSESDDMDEYK